jgi:hypothetical protein
VKRYTWSDEWGDFRDSAGEPCTADVVVDAADYAALEAQLRRDASWRKWIIEECPHCAAKLAKIERAADEATGAT